MIVLGHVPLLDASEAIAALAAGDVELAEVEARLTRAAKARDRRVLYADAWQRRS